MTEFATKGK